MTRTTEWLNSNRHRTYPFVEDADLTLDNGVEIPTGAVLDMHAAVYYRSFRAVYMTGVSVVATAVPSIVFDFKFDGYPAVAFQLEVPATAAFPYTATLSDLSFYHVSATFGEDVLQLLDTLNLPSSRELAERVRVEPAVVKFHEKHQVNQIQAVGVTGEEEVLTGGAFNGVLCREGHNCIISLDSESNTMRVVASLGAGAGKSCEEDSDSDNLTCAETVLYINGMHGNNLGEFRIYGGPGVEVEALPDDHEIRVRGTISGDELRACGS